MDKGLERELKELGLESAGHKPFMLGEEEARHLGAKCRDCWSPKVVYFIVNPLSQVFEPGGYCYPCLLKRCRASRMTPYPIDSKLLNRLKADMGIPLHQAPKYIFKRGR